MRRVAGFTMIELLLTVAVLTIVAGISLSVLQVPYAAYVEQRIQATLTNRASIVSSRLGRDIRHSLPNSLRSSGTALELLDVRAIARYRAEGPSAEAQRLRTGIADDSFNTLTALGDTGVTAGEYLAVYPLGIGASDPWTGTAMTPSLVSLSVAGAAPPGPAGYDNEFQVTFSPPHNFPLQSPARRVYRVSGPVSYLCEGDQLLRFAGYSPAAVQPTATADFAGMTGVVIASGVTDCDFAYTVVNGRYGIVRTNLALSERDETVRLSWQMRVENTP